MGKTKFLPIPFLWAFLLLGCGGDSGGDRSDDVETMTLTASGISPTEIALSWTPPRGDPEDNYWIYMNGDFLSELPPTQTSTVVSGLAPNTSYCFEVRISTDLRLLGEFSNEACATTLP